MDGTESSTSTSLLQQLRHFKNEVAWERFVAKYVPFIDRHLTGAGLNDADVEEVRSRVLVCMTQAMRAFNYDPAKRFRGYLSRCIRNEMITYLRELSRRPGSVGTGNSWTREQVDRGELPETFVAMSDELDERIRQGLRRWQQIQHAVRPRVSEQSWQVFERVVLGGEAPSHVAQDLGMTLQAVCMARKRVLDMIRHVRDSITER
jgi:RNA polymerase sigma-70 factor (ECF subfamily)